MSSQSIDSAGRSDGLGGLGQQWYINFPSALAQAMEFEKGEEVEWIVADKAHLILSRQHAPPDPVSVRKTTRS
ncbi:MAG: hypothetical protein WB696_02075 [Chthoniobacterales bacterium]